MGRVSGTCRSGRAMDLTSKSSDRATPRKSLMCTRLTASSREPSQSGESGVSGLLRLREAPGEVPRNVQVGHLPPRHHHLAHLHVVEVKRRVQELLFRRRQLARLAAEPDVRLDLVLGDDRGAVAAGEQVREPLGDLDDRGEGPLHPGERPDDEAPQAAPVGGAEGLGQDFAHKEDGHGEGGRDRRRPAGAQDPRGIDPADGGARGVGDGVEHEDRRRRLRDVGLHRDEALGDPGMPALGPRGLQGAQPRRVERRLEQRADARYEDGERRHQDQPEH